MNTKERPTLTTAAGIPVGDNQNSLTAGRKGPLLAQDWQLFEKHAHFNRERIPERLVHAKGSGAYGTLRITGDISRYTKAKALQPGAESECFLRFSTVAGERRTSSRVYSNFGCMVASPVGRPSVPPPKSRGAVQGLRPL